MKWVWGVVTTVISVIVQLLILSTLGFNFFSFSMFFIIPAGGIFLGAIATFGYFYKIVRQGLKPNKNNYFISVIFILLSFCGFMYGEYQMAYVSASNEINYKFEGEHISNFVFRGSDEPITLLNYYDYKFNNSSLSIFSRGHVSNAIDIEPNKWVNVSKFLIQCVGLLIGGLGAGMLMTNGKTHCSSCNKAYLQEHKLLDVNSEMIEPVISEINQYIQNNNGEGLTKYITEQKAFCEDAASDTNVKYGFKFGHCPNCQQGYLIKSCYTLDKHGNFVEQEDKKAVISISQEIVASVLKAG
ncbi:hypothetical protein AMQ84_25525 [Paenibacillus riograndensis]|uniref:Uncharacterized protein n=1 Tax=Paenibacillus riograndensis TaxID=483937 RepID=A0A132TNM4_9BACL|nr:hypothetical protein [Paenibacillus riograndensis]KWX72626.1 hypothetical protein AMQ84_25525 [Paenibacillus riograndensis]